MTACQIDLQRGIYDFASQAAAVEFGRGERRMDMAFDDFDYCIEFKGIISCMHPLNSFV